MAKTLKEYFKKYLPTPEQDSILSNAIATSAKIDQENRIIELRAEFNYIVPKEVLYEIEAGVCGAYNLRFCKILPHYPAVLFSYEYIPQILIETERVGVVAKGFFGNYTYTLDEGVLTIKIPFSANGIGLLENANTPTIIENIIYSEFSVKLKVKIEQNGSLDLDRMSDDYTERMRYFDKQISAASKRYGEYVDSDKFVLNFSIVTTDAPSEYFIWGKHNPHVFKVDREKSRISLVTDYTV